MTEATDVEAASPPRRCTIAIIGGGPAGLMAAEVAAHEGHAVTIYERMPSIGRKLLMAGRGGLNLTHSEPLDLFLTRYTSGGAAIAPIIRALPPADLIRWADGLGQETFEGSSGRIFPKAMKASPLLRAWLARLERLGVTIRTRHRWLGFGADGALRFSDATGTEIQVTTDATILALGGASWPRLGSDGSWVETLRRADFDIADLTPANVGAAIAWSDVVRDRFLGEPLKRLAVTCGGRTVRGEAVVTKAGLEGGAIYALTPEIRAGIARDGQAEITLDLRPDVTLAALAERLAKPRGKQTLSNHLRKAGNLPPVATAMMREATGGPLPNDPAELAARVKAATLRVTGLGGLDRAISTAGGVRFAGLDAHLMVRARPGVFIAGEMLDWDAPTGGYLLQASFATGAAAAHGANRWLVAQG